MENYTSKIKEDECKMPSDRNTQSALLVAGYTVKHKI